MSCLDTILELSHEQLLIWGWGWGANGSFNGLDEIVLHQFGGTVSYVGQSGGGHLLVTTGGELVYDFSHQFLIIGDGSSR